MLRLRCFVLLILLQLVNFIYAKRFIIPFHALISSSSLALSESNTSASSDNCKDGACSIDSQPSNNLEDKVLKEWNESLNNNSTSTIIDDTNDGKVKELVKLGWKESQALLALNHTKYNVEEAINLLEKEEEEYELLQANIKIIHEKYGWKVEAAESALIQTNQNITASLELLENEEKVVIDNFELTVQDMVKNGWHEFVARQALVTQWTIDQKTAAGINVTFPVDSLQNIRPTLKHQNETAGSTKAAAGSGATKQTKKDVNKPTPANKEDCVFDITSENFQKLVVESPVPVILDVYADWCGPCKQLGK